MKGKITQLMPMVFVGAVAAAIAVAPAAYAVPPPPPCTNFDGSPCSGLGNINAGGADINIPYGPSGTADRGGATGGIPYGPSGSADASGCIPNVGCLSIP